MDLVRRLSTSFGSLRSSRSSRASIISTTSTSTTNTTNTTTTAATSTTTANGNLTGEMLLTSNSEFDQVKYSEEKEVLVMASIKAPTFEKKEEDKRAPIDLCCVIDKSGSMAGEKLNLVKQAMLFVVDNLDSRDQLSVVLYDSNVSTLFDFVLMDSKSKENCKSAINGITDGSSTNLYGGLDQGLSLCKKRKSPSDICSVLLFTDGLANVGIQKSPEICVAMKKALDQFSSKQKCSVFTFGFGSDHDENMLRSIAETGNGMYYFVASTDAIPLSFADCLGGLQSVVAQNMNLKVKPLNNTTILKSLNTRYNLKGDLPNSKDISLELGDIYSEEFRDIIFLVKVNSLKEPLGEPIPIIQFELTFFNTIKVDDESRTVELKISRPKAVDSSMVPNAELDKQRNRLRVADAMEESRKLADAGKLEDAKKLMNKAKTEVKSSATNDDAYCQKLLLEVDQCVDDMRDTHVYKEKGSKNISRKAQAHYYQRSNKLYEEDVSFYETSSKVESKSKAKSFF